MKRSNPRSHHPILVAALGAATTAALGAALAACGAPDVPPADPLPPRSDVPDAIGVRPADPRRTETMLARARDMVRPGSVVQTEPRFGVPTFLWARAPMKVVPQPRLAGVPHPEVAASRAAIARYASLYGLQDADVSSAVVSHVHDLGTGPVIVKYKAAINGVEIFREELNVVMSRELEPLALSGYLTSAATPSARGTGLAFQLAAPASAVHAIAHMAGAQLDPAQLVFGGARDGYAYYTLAASAKLELDDAIRVKQVYFHTADGLEPAYYLELLAHTGTAPFGTLSADGSPVAAPEGYAYVVSAVNGQLLFRKNLIAEARGGAAAALPPGGFTYRVWADPVTGIPYETPAGNDIDPKINPIPDGVQYPFVATNDVQLPNFPFSNNDPWLAPTATETVGNNVDAFINLLPPDGYVGPVTTTPKDPLDGDYRAQLTAPGQFLHTQTPDGITGDLTPSRKEGRQGAIQQLFYNINFLHDWFYDSGFNEAAGNAQTDNFGRGGLGGDSIKGQAQDFSGFSNANMLTGADGARPRMRMYVFPSPANNLELVAPAFGKANIGISMSGPQFYDSTADIVIATFSAAPACAVTNAAALAGKIAFFQFNAASDGTNCQFSPRIAAITGTAAVGMVMMFDPAGNANPNGVANITGFVAINTKPVATISQNNGTFIKAQLANGPITARLFRAPDRDGSIDQQIVFHEFFHYVSNRLVANGSGLGTQQSAGMGEGWSDFASMLLTVRQNDTAVASNPTFNGVYSLASFATSGVPITGLNQGYYFGIRRYPYSTDMTKNPLTFHHVTNGIALPAGPPVGFGADGANNSEVHNVGEVWTTMLWECYSALLQDTLGDTPRLTFQQAQDRMKAYVIAGLKVTPAFPTITEARDAILAVALATDQVDYVIFRRAFAKRGAGGHAISADRGSTALDGVVEDFNVGPELTFVSATLDDTAGSCDDDGVLDHGEFGTLTFKVRNTGITTLSATTAAITTASPDVYFPDGADLSFSALALGEVATKTVRIAYSRNVTGIQQLEFQLDLTDPQLGGPESRVLSFRTNTDEDPAVTATDTVEAVAPPWTKAFNPALANAAPWHRVEVSAMEHAWHADDAGTGTDQYLISPTFTVDGAFKVEFDHSWAFEFDASGNFDGGVIEMSVNGAAFTDIGASAYNGTILTYPADVNPLQGRPGFVKVSDGTVHTALTPTVAAGSTVQIRFRLGSDGAAGAPGWNVDNIAFSGVTEKPFATVVPDDDTCTKVPGSADLAITVSDGVDKVLVGNTVTYTIVAANAAGDDMEAVDTATAFSPDATCTWTCTGAGGATCAAGGTGNITDRIKLPSGSAATYLATCSVSATTANTSLAATATIAGPTQVADPATGNNTATDTDQILRVPAHLIGTKTVAGDFVPGGTVTYSIVVTNTAAGKQFDNAGPEITDQLPLGLALVTATASSGTASASLADNKVTWDGVILAGGSVTLTVVATISAPAGTQISNQASFVFDADGDAANETTGSTEALPCPPTP